MFNKKDKNTKKRQGGNLEGILRTTMGHVDQTKLAGLQVREPGEWKVEK